MKRTRGRLFLCLALLTVNLLFIWGNSLLPEGTSSVFSSWVKDILARIFPGLNAGGGDRGHAMVRKLAHFSEFALLGLLLRWLFAMLLTRTFPQFGMPLLAGFLVACLDEIIQSFVPGRNPSLFDVGIDTAGVVLGIVLITLIHNQIIKSNKGVKL